MVRKAIRTETSRRTPGLRVDRWGQDIHGDTHEIDDWGSIRRLAVFVCISQAGQRAGTRLSHDACGLSNATQGRQLDSVLNKAA